MGSDPRLGTTLAGYRIESLLGRGGMSVVYLAEDQRLKRKAALKVLATELAEDESFRQRFIAESELAASLDHPNVIPIFEAGEAEGVLYIAMRYVRSTDLKALIHREGRLTPERTISILAQAASALDAAHAQGLVHRDVKPGNILVAEGQGAGKTDHVYLSDFGLTKRQEAPTGLTRTGQFVGTVDYVAPEQIEGRGIDGRTDEYALACVVYECLTGQSPYPKETETAVLVAHLMQPPPSLAAVLPDLPAGLSAVVERGMAKAKEDRFPDCASMITAAADAIGLGSGEYPMAPRSATKMAPPPPTPVGASGGSAPPRPFETGEPFAVPPGPVTPPPGPVTPPPGPVTPPPRRRPTPPAGKRRRTGLLAGVGSAVVAIAVLAFVLLSGGHKASNSGGGGPVSTCALPAGPSPAVATTIFSDEFSTQAGRWDHALTAKSKVGYLNGAYQMVIREGGQFATASPHVPAVNCLGDVRVAVDATLAVAHGQNGFGVACRTNGGTNSYYLLISSTGNYAIQKSVNGDQTNLANSSDPRILKGRSTNHIEALCQNRGSGVLITLSVNGNEIFSSFDKTDVLLSGTVGLVEISKTPGLDVRYDNFTVSQAASA